MLTFVLRRAARLCAVLLAISAVSFLLIHLIPGNPAQILLGQRATHADIVRLTHALALDRPWYVQYVTYLWHALHGDLGDSLADHVPVAEKLAAYFPATVELAAGGMVFAVGIGVPLGVLAAVYHRRLIDIVANLLVLAGVSVPVFWLGWMLLWLFAYEPSRAGLNLFPLAGRLSPAYDIPVRTHLVILDAVLAGNGRALLDALWHLALPAVTLGTIPLAVIAKMTRAGVLEVLGSDYVRTARAKGLRPWRVVIRHALRNALVPVLTVAGLQTGFLLGGAVLTESIFAWPGVGRLAFEAVSNRDYPLINGTILVFAAAFAAVNFCVDLAYAWLDPKVRYA